MAYTSDSEPPPLCPWESFYRPSDLRSDWNHFEPLGWTAPKSNHAEADDPVAAPDRAIFDWNPPQHSAPLVSNNLQLPTPAECATHLLLLQAFLDLRIKVLCSRKLDTALGIEPHERVVHVPHNHPKHRGSSSDDVVRVQDPTFLRRREEKWNLFISLAAARFMAWARAVSSDAGGFELPPIDVLLIWHALLLNQGWVKRFQVSCKKIKALLTVEFPWSDIHTCIDHHSYAFTIPPTGATRFRDITGMDADLLAYLTSQASQETRLAKSLRLYGRSGSATDPLKIRGLTADDFPETYAPASRCDKSFLQAVRSTLDDRDDNHAMVVQLAGAVRRQSVFVNKMDYTLWIASPALAGTLRRGIQRYERFLRLFRPYDPRRVRSLRDMLVPTLDVDLVWYTHLCSSPVRYESYCTALVGRFIEYDDSLKEMAVGKLDDAWNQTSQLYRIRYGSEYRICLCWECEALRSAVEGEDGGGLLRERDEKEIANEVLMQTTRYRVAERKKRAAWPRVS
ncbi:hypothetical protein Micbo1qcDRAFT_232335 [Microdochium bolleyi]|uniref:F-box domain-containing protein n=1 Tax=Microdochium bolleyi TaxID=196109 RepID=A0A136J630_9PEZI|nr:hypothetical protein Micbo1qcDRAFT_232335 [Microdochium bolleyi]